MDHNTPVQIQIDLSTVGDTNRVQTHARCLAPDMKRHVSSAQNQDAIDMEMTDEQWRPNVSLSSGRVRLVMVAVLLSLVVVYLDGFILSPALPVIATEFQATGADYAWVASADVFAMAIGVPIFGRASDIFGRRYIMILTNTIFLVGTCIGGSAHNITAVIAGRLIQGIGCGGLIVVAGICVIDLFSPRARGVYFSMIGTVSATASAAGPILGGVLASKASWRWCFWINIPCAVLSFCVMSVCLKLPKPTTPVKKGLKETDWLGMMLLTAAMILILVGLQLGGTSKPWSSGTVVSLVVGGFLALAGFFWVEKSLAAQPLIPISIFADISRASIIIAMIANAMISAGAKNFLVLYFQLVLAVSPLESAVYYLPYAIGLGLILPFVGWGIKRTGKYKVMICTGMCVLTLGAGLLIDAMPKRNWPLIIVPQILQAVGVGLTYQSTNIAFQAHIQQAHGSAAQSAFQLLRNSSQMISVIVGQILFQAQLSSHAEQLDSENFGADLGAALASGNIFEALAATRKLRPAQVYSVHELLTASFQSTWILYTVIGFVGVMASLRIADTKMS